MHDKRFALVFCWQSRRHVVLSGYVRHGVFQARKIIRQGLQVDLMNYVWGAQML